MQSTHVLSRSPGEGAFTAVMDCEYDTAMSSSEAEGASSCEKPDRTVLSDRDSDIEFHTIRARAKLGAEKAALAKKKEAKEARRLTILEEDKQAMEVPLGAAAVPYFPRRSGALTRSASGAPLDLEAIMGARIRALIGADTFGPSTPRGLLRHNIAAVHALLR